MSHTCSFRTLGKDDASEASYWNTPLSGASPLRRLADDQSLYSTSCTWISHSSGTASLSNRRTAPYGVPCLPNLTASKCADTAEELERCTNVRQPCETGLPFSRWLAALLGSAPERNKQWFEIDLFTLCLACGRFPSIESSNQGFSSSK